MLDNLGFSVTNNLYISNMCHVITEESIIEDYTNNHVGTTNCGIGQTLLEAQLNLTILILWANY